MSGNIGSILGGTGSLINSISSLFGSTTTTTGSSSGTAQSKTSGTATSNTQAFQDTQSSQNTTGLSTTTNNSTTINTADAQGIATLRQLINSALVNSTNTDQTNSLVAGIFQSAKDAFASTFGTQAASGLYNSSTTGVLASDAEARATADAASAVLGYQTQEQQIANQGLQQLLAVTGISSTSGTSVTQQSQDTTGTSTSEAVSNTQQTNATVQNQKEAQQSTSTTQQSKGTLICTWMINHGMMDTRVYCRISKQFYRDYSRFGRASYHFWAELLVKFLENNSKSWQSKIILYIFNERSNYVNACENKHDGKKKLTGFLCKKLVYCVCFPVGIFIYLDDLAYHLVFGKVKKVKN